MKSLLILFLVIWKLRQSSCYELEESLECVTPHVTAGRCGLLRDCPQLEPLTRILSTVEFVSSFGCGVISDGNLRVCCPFCAAKGIDNLLTVSTQNMLLEFLEEKDSEHLLMEFLKQKETEKRLRNANCKLLLDNGVTQSGVYRITPKGFSDGVEVFCDQDTDGGGWNVFLRRKNQINPLNFIRTFKEYEEGFGDPMGEMWIGNKLLHSMTGDQNFILRVEAKNPQNEWRTGIWETFSVGSKDTNFTLSLGGYSAAHSTLGDAITFVHDQTVNGMMFSTFDQDNDGMCSAGHRGRVGWWFNSCGTSNPTGPFGEGPVHNDKAYWQYWDPPTVTSRIHLSEIEFKIRPHIH